MKKLLLITIFILFCLTLNSHLMTQTTPVIVLTASDIQVSFPDAANPDWIAGEDPTFTVGDVTYSIEPIGQTKTTLKLQTTETVEVELFGSTTDDPRKAIIPVTLTSSSQTRSVQFRTRCRWSDDPDDADAGPWTVSNVYKVIGKTNAPVLVK